MIEAATFVKNPSGRVEVMLGAHVVATIYPLSDGARYHIKLPGCEGARLVGSMVKARRLILQVLADWCEAAGPLFAPAAETLAAQSEVERDAEMSISLFAKSSAIGANK